MPYYQKTSPHISLLYKRLPVSMVAFFIWSGGSQIPTRRSLNTNLWLWSHTLWKLSSRSTRIWSELTSRAATVEMMVALEECYITDQMSLVTSVARNAINRKTAGQRELALVVTHPRNTQTIFHNRWPRSLLLQKPKIWQQTPWRTTIKVQVVNLLQ